MAVASQAGLVVITQDDNEYGEWEAEQGLSIASQYPRLAGHVVRFSILPTITPKPVPARRSVPARVIAAPMQGRTLTVTERALANIVRDRFGEDMEPLFS